MLLNQLDSRIFHIKQHLDSGGYVIVQPKLNGVRAVLTVDGFFTRSGAKILRHVHKTWDRFFKKFPDAVLDGEIVEVNGSPHLSYILSLIEQDDTEDLGFAAFDMISEKPFIDRWTDLRILHEGVHWQSSVDYNFATVGAVVISDFDALIALTSDFAPTDDKEGLVIRLPMGTYQQGKRSNDVLKWKPFDDCEVSVLQINWNGAKPVSAVVSHDGKNINTTISGSASYWKSVGAPNGRPGTIRHQVTATSEIRDPVLVCLRDDI
jgi:ATP-dependent DNA ligase